MSEFEKKSPRQHVLDRCEMYLGSDAIEEVEKHVLLVDENGDKCEKRKIVISDVIERIFLEILSNAGDNVRRSEEAGINPGKIQVDVVGKKVSIYNEGKHIPTGMHEKEGIPIPELIFGNLLTGSNYDDEKERYVCGRNGIGAKATNIFSKHFIIEIGDPVKRVVYRQLFTDNMKKRNDPKIEGEYNGIGYTRITYFADFERLYGKDDTYNLKGYSGYTEDMIACFGKHCVDISFTCHVPIKFNGRVLDYSDLDKYSSLYIRNPTTNNIKYEDENTQLVVFDTPDKGEAITFVNGIITSKGGVHVSTWLDKFCVPIVEKLKKHAISKKDIKPHLTLIGSFRLDKPRFKGQTKEYLSAPKPKVLIQDNVLNQMTKWDLVQRIIQGINAMNMKALSKTDGKKTTFVDVLKAEDARLAGGPKYKNCVLFLTEGDSASTFACKGIGNKRDIYGTFPLKGKPLNTSKSTNEKIADNVEITNIKKLLGLKEGVDYSDDKIFNTLRYGAVCILADQDVDGRHIEALIYNMFRKYPALLKRGYVKVMYTPLIKVCKGQKMYKSFYSLKEYEEWKKTDDCTSYTKKWNISYYKGLGSSEDDDIEEAFLNSTIISYKYDDKCETSFSLIFDRGNEDQRKKWLLSYDKDKEDPNSSKGTFSHFLNNDLILYSLSDLQRSIPCVWDGLKPAQRKVLYALIKRGRPAIFPKVSQLIGYVSDETKYHNGEKSLGEVIINMAQDYIGSNNIPLIEGKGQFGSRKGGDAADPRYIFAAISTITSWIFRSEDDILLEYKDDEGKAIEPVNYLPIIPMFAVNGCEGIGTGFSTSIPCYNPKTIILWIKQWLLKRLTQGKSDKPIDLPILVPWYKGYEGIIRKRGERWISEGSFDVENGDIIVNELPITVTINCYAAKLAKKKEKGKIKDFKTITTSVKQKKYIFIPNFIIRGCEQPNLKNLGLISTIGDKNITLFDGNGICKKYSTIESAIDEFCHLRLGKYQERKAKIIPQLESELVTEHLRYHYIEDVNSNKIIVTGRPESDILSDMHKSGYPDSFLDMRISSFSTNKLLSLQSKIDKIKEQISYYNSISPEKLWWNDLRDLEKHI